MPSRHSGNAGFSLIEIAIVVVIAGILLSLFTGSLMTMASSAKLKTTQTRLQEIDRALRSYASNNNRLPCAASREETVNTVNYGRETSQVHSTTCVLAPQIGTVKSGNVRIGMVPTRTLNLPDEYGYDGWGSRFVYAVTEGLAATNTYNLANGGISVVASDKTTSMVNPPGRATYVVLSVGPDKEGGYNTNGERISDCTNGLDVENCNDDHVFMDTFLRSDTVGTEQFDDNVIYAGNFQTSVIPAGAIMAFSLENCPTGWTVETNAVGRFVVGAGSGYSEVAPALPLTDIGGNHAVDYALGAKAGRLTVTTPPPSAGSAGTYDNVPPYVAYLYCRKL